MGVINLGALVEKLRKKLSGSGFVTNTDYATSSTGGVIKTNSTYATDISSGSLKAKEITASNYASANNAAFISKKTLDNLITAGTLGGGGLTQLYTAPAEPVTITNNLEFTLTDNAENYKGIVIVMMSGDYPVTIVGVPVNLEYRYFTGIYFDLGNSSYINYGLYIVSGNKFKRSFLIGETSTTVCKLLAVYGMN